MPYVDGFVLAVPKKNIPAYKRMARKAGKVWKEHGALEFRECCGDDLQSQWGTPFAKLARTKPGETVFFSYIVYKSRAHRDRVNKKVMTDKRIVDSMKKEKMPFDAKRMAYGGFKVLVDL